MRTKKVYLYGVVVAVLIAAGAFVSLVMSSAPIAKEGESLSLSADGYRTAQTGADIQKCKQGDAMACFNAATKYEAGSGVPRDSKVASDYFARACDMKFAGGCAGVAMLSDGTDVIKAEQFLRKACELNDEPSCSKLASAEKKPAERKAK